MESPFRLLRYFSITSFLATLIVASLLGIFYRWIAVQDLTALGESKNIVLTKAFANSIWPEFASFVRSASRLSAEELRAHPETAKLYRSVREQMKGLAVVKVKIYNLEGLTVFSTETSQIGDDKSTNPGFIAARAGKVASLLTHRGQIYAFEGAIEDRDIITSYIPIRLDDSDGRPIEGVFELYYDVTPLIQRMNRTQRIVVTVVVLALGGLYFALLFVVRRADRIIKSQHLQRKQYLEQLEAEMTERKQAEKALRENQQQLVRQAEELELSNAELEQFAYVASHDLQEPLRMVGGYTQLLAKRYKGKLDSDADEFIAFAVDGVTRMQQLINDLLAYSRVGTRGKEFEPTNCQTVFDQALLNLQVAIEETGATVVHDPLPTVMGDATQLGQVFQNLIGNAIKFRGEQPPEVHVGAERRDGEWLFWVQDNGIGIAREDAERIFTIFQRLHEREKYPGTGLGLAICKKIVGRHSGRIWVESEPGKGATFYLTIPDRGVKSCD